LLIKVEEVFSMWVGRGKRRRVLREKKKTKILSKLESHDYWPHGRTKEGGNRSIDQKEGDVVLQFSNKTCKEVRGKKSSSVIPKTNWGGKVEGRKRMTLRSMEQKMGETRGMLTFVVRGCGFR